MKKFLVIFMALIGLMSCKKDGANDSLYYNACAINNVTYEITIRNGEDFYQWSSVNKTEEVTYHYTFNYERKTDIQKDFAAIVEGLNEVDDVLLPVFTRTLKFSSDDVRDAVITKVVEGGNVFVHFVVGTRSFRLPYDFIIEANDVLNPKE